MNFSLLFLILITYPHGSSQAVPASSDLPNHADMWTGTDTKLPIIAWKQESGIISQRTQGTRRAPGADRATGSKSTTPTNTSTWSTDL
ncbi:hypothetical protein Q7C36_009990 [Tachysurus vachellii]|uniref:Uncharacterized protein n=1 Tax=Tachysurus vachellii TaxID=175792 RepID=A0AA88SRE5_TACVA|nr:hypothetical protein Q7C36_009990 [Tachysurus vachellii]